MLRNMLFLFNYNSLYIKSIVVLTGWNKIYDLIFRRGK